MDGRQLGQTLSDIIAADSLVELYAVILIPLVAILTIGATLYLFRKVVSQGILERFYL